MLRLRDCTTTGIRATCALVATLMFGTLGGQAALAQQGYRMPSYRTAPTARPTTYGMAQPARTYTRYYSQPSYTTAAAQPAAAAATYDGAWFVNWLNGVRAQYGLSAVGYDANLASWAAANSAEQTRRGLGHFIMGPARRQNSAMGSAGSIGSMWMNSPAHRAALLDPSIRWIGLAGAGAYWTFNAR